MSPSDEERTRASAGRTRTKRHGQNREHREQRSSSVLSAGWQRRGLGWNGTMVETKNNFGETNHEICAEKPYPNRKTKQPSIVIPDVGNILSRCRLHSPDILESFSRSAGLRPVSETRNCYGFRRPQRPAIVAVVGPSTHYFQNNWAIY
jgi:hypothetical protein